MPPANQDTVRGTQIRTAPGTTLTVSFLVAVRAPPSSSYSSIYVAAPLTEWIDRKMKDRLGKLAYVWAGLRHVNGEPATARILVDGVQWFDDEASCVLIGNVGTITGGIHAFDDAKPDDGWLDVGVATAQGALQWARALGTMAVGRSDSSPFVRTTRARRVDVKLKTKMEYELDGGARTKTKSFSASVAPGAVKICVPRESPEAA